MNDQREKTTSAEPPSNDRDSNKPISNIDTGGSTMYQSEENQATPVKLDSVPTIEQRNHNPGSPSINTIAQKIEATISRHCVLTLEAITAITLFCIATYAINCFRIFPRLVIWSAERRCGKSTVLEIVEACCKNSEMVSNATAASIFRLIEINQPTLILDEADTYVQNGSEELRGILNSGHNHKTASVMRCVGPDNTPTKFSTWSPMVLASIEPLQSTIMDRSVVVILKRKLSHEHVDMLPVDLMDEFASLREDLASWAESSEQRLKDETVIPVDLGNDRAADNWIVLHTVAKLIGGDWPAKCNDAYRTLTKTDEPELKTQLLIDIQEVFNSKVSENPTDLNPKVFSTDLVNALKKLPDTIWGSCYSSQPLTAKSMAIMLKPYQIQSSPMRIGQKTGKGYELDDFLDAFARYIP